MCYLDTAQKKDCNGCGVCALKCSKKAITMIEDSEGFLYPKVDLEKCINCGICKKNCSNILKNNDKDNFYNPKIFSAYNKNIEIVMKSSSGGMFLTLANKIISENGVVFGVKYDENINACFGHAETIEELTKFCGSKYVRAIISDEYTEVKKYLNQNIKVLFTGTPCQCYALKKYLGKEYENLYLCEILCHANPSPKVFDLYKKAIELKEKEKISDIMFRSKKNGWKNQTPIIKFKSGREIQEKSYFFAFVRELFNRPSCHNCKFYGKYKKSDFAIGDFWGINKIDTSIVDNDTGISVFGIYSSKGEELFNEIKKNITYKEYTLEQAFKYNRNSNNIPHIYRNLFFRQIRKKKIDEKNIIEKMKFFTQNRTNKILNKIYRKIMKKIKNKKDGKRI